MVSFARLTLVGSLLVCFAFPALAQTTPLLGDTSFQPTQPSASQVALGRELVLNSGMSRSFNAMIIQTMTQINTTVTATRPELIPDMRTVLTQLQPEFNKRIDDAVDRVGRVFAAMMTEQELKESVAYFKSASGKKYVDIQPNLFANIGPIMDGWSKQNSYDFMARVREEMKKKGRDF